MTTIYLSSDNPSWVPRTEADIKAAVDGGLIEESAYLDAKLQVLTKSDNKEFARDLASFANNGGTLIIGVGEDKAARRFFCQPQALNGLAEKIDSVARTIPDPPISVVTKDIPSDADPTLGYLVVHVPANPQAPHMVDGKYYGRDDKAKHVLTDVEVARLHARRTVAEDAAITLLRDEISRDPLAEYGDQSHIFFVAQPLAGRPDALVGLTSGTNWNSRLGEFVNTASDSPQVRTALGELNSSISLVNAGQGTKRAGGAARHTYNLGDGRMHRPGGTVSDEHVIEVQVFEDGGLRLYFSELSSPFNAGPQRINDWAAVALVLRFIGLVLGAAAEARYFGGWTLAVGATRLQGRTIAPGNSFSHLVSYDRDTYERATAATWAELHESPGAVSNRLIGPLLRGLNIETAWHKHLSAPDNES